MPDNAIHLPDTVRRKAKAQGRDGERWLNHLPSLVGGIEREWCLTVGSALSGGSEAFVAIVRMDSKDDAILKIEMPPYTSFANEVRTLIAADGRGYARLIRYDQSRHATLQERLGPSLREMNLPVSQQMAIICATLRLTWEIPAPPTLQTGAEKA